MEKYSNPAEVLKDLLEFNDSVANSSPKNNGKALTVSEIQDTNESLLFNLCDLLGCKNIYEDRVGDKEL